MAAAVVCGLLITLYRNDVLYDMAHAVGLGSSYESFEGVFGKPGFGTPRSVESAPQLPSSEEPKETASKETTSSSTSWEERTVPAPEQPSTPASDASTKSPQAQKTSSGSSAPRTTAPAKKTPAKAAPAKKTSSKGRNSEYDPMNASL